MPGREWLSQDVSVFASQSEPYPADLKGVVVFLAVVNTPSESFDADGSKSMGRQIDLTSHTDKAKAERRREMYATGGEQ